MKNYDVYFELFGKKMKTKVLAESEVKAKEEVKNKIIFHKVAKVKDDAFNDVTDIIDKMKDFFK